jgi:hypothetical protein
MRFSAADQAQRGEQERAGHHSAECIAMRGQWRGGAQDGSEA